MTIKLEIFLETIDETRTNTHTHICMVRVRQRKQDAPNSRKWGIPMSLYVRLFVRYALWEYENVKRVCVQIIITSSNIYTYVGCSWPFWVGLSWRVFSRSMHMCVRVCVRVRECADVMPKANHCCLQPIFSCRFEHALNFVDRPT